jgi:rubredoxin
MIKAKGHTLGNSMVIVEDDGLFYMLHGDITYTDEALYQNKLSVVFEDVKEARITLDRVREFVSHRPTVYLSTHTPQGYENLEGKRVVDLNNPPETIPVGEIVYKTKSGKYVCSICGYVYDPKETGVSFEDLPDDWRCPRCKQPKSKFNPA